MKNTVFLILFLFILTGCGTNNKKDVTAAEDKAVSDLTIAEEKAVSDLTAEDAVKQIYDEVFDAYIHLPLEKLFTIDFDHKFLSSEFLRLDSIVTEIDKKYPGELGFRDYNHWVQAQDWENLSYTIDSTEQVSDTKAEVWMSISNFGTKSTPLQLSMVKENGVWKIGDFIADGRSECSEMEHYIEIDNDSGI